MALRHLADVCMLSLFLLLWLELGFGGEVMLRDVGRGSAQLKTSSSMRCPGLEIRSASRQSGSGVHALAPQSSPVDIICGRCQKGSLSGMAVPRSSPRPAGSA